MATIKITELDSIGINLTSSTVIPVVNMSGTPTTEKTLLGNIANVVLTGAGNSFLPAGRAILAQSVTNAAQPNITSVGTLTSLAVSGNVTVNGNITSNGTAYVGNLSTTGLASITTLAVGATANLGAVGNVKITGGTDGYVLQTDGTGNLSWTAQTGGGGGTVGGANTQVQFNDAGDFGGNAGFTFDKTTGIFTSPFIAGNGNGLSNIQGANVSGAVNLATFAGTANAVAGANVSGAVNLATFAGTANAVAGANVSGTVGNANLSQFIDVSSVNDNFSYHIVLSAGAGDKSIHIDADDNLQYNPADGTLTAVRVDASYVLADLQFSHGYPAANVTGLGNIATINLTGSNANLLYGNGVFAAVPAPTVSQDITSNGAMSIMTYDGNLKYVNYATVEPSSGNIAGGNISANGNISGGNISATGNITANNLGNISSINIDGSNSNVLYGNGVFAAVAGGNANTGNVTFDDVTVQGVNGLNLSAGADFTANLAYLQVRAGDVASHIHLDTGNNQAYDLIVGDDQNYVQVSSTGNILLSAYDSNTSQYTWTLDYNGNLILAGGNSVIQSIANSSLDPTLPNVSTMTLTPDQNYNSQSLVLDPTLPGHIHLRAYAFSNIDEPSANIFLGGEDTAFEITSGANNQAVIHSNGKAWTFGNDGNISSDTLTFTTTFANVKTVEYQTAGVWDLYVEDSITGSNTAISRLNVSFKDNLIDKPQVYIENTKESDGIALRWTFDENGNLNFPRDVAGNSDPYLNIFGGSTPTIQSTDVSLAGPANLAIQSDYLNLSGSTGNRIILQADAGAIATDAAMVLSTNLADLGNVYSWTFGADGILTVPGDLVAVSASPAPSISGFSSVSALAFTNGNSNVTVNANSNLWNFDSTGNLTIPGSSGGFIKTVSNASIGIAAMDNGTNNPAQLLSLNVGTGAATSIVSAYATNVAIQTNAAGAINTWAFDNAGNLTLPTGGQIIVSGGLVSSGASPAPTINGFSITNSVGISGNGNIAGNNISATGNISANNFTGNGGTLSNVATKVEGSWTLASGTNTVNISVPLNGTYAIWVNGNIPNGIVTYTATAVVTNTNVPVLGEQYGWFYELGNALVLTSIPNQFVGTQGVISNASPYSGNTANVFTFGITNNSGNTAVVNYGYTKL